MTCRGSQVSRHRDNPSWSREVSVQVSNEGSMRSKLRCPGAVFRSSPSAWDPAGNEEEAGLLRASAWSGDGDPVGFGLEAVAGDVGLTDDSTGRSGMSAWPGPARGPRRRPVRDGEVACRSG